MKRAIDERKRVLLRAGDSPLVSTGESFRRFPAFQTTASVQLAAGAFWAREVTDQLDPLSLVLAKVAGGGSSNRSGRRRPAWGEVSASILRRAITPAGG